MYFEVGRSIETLYRLGDPDAEVEVCVILWHHLVRRGELRLLRLESPGSAYGVFELWLSLGIKFDQICDRCSDSG